MELRRYLDIAKRQKWLIVQALLVVAVVAGVLSNLRTPTYQATARVLLRPNDPSEQINPSNSASIPNPDRYVAAQIDIIKSAGVAGEAAKAVKGATPDEFLRAVSVSQAGVSDLINITGTSIDPERAKAVANAFAHSYIENRRLYAVGSLKRATDDIEAKLGQLQARIAQLDKAIGDGGIQPGATIAPVTGSGLGVPAPTAPGISAPTGTGLTDGALPTSNEGLKAARYAAATQYQSLFLRQQDLLIDMSLKRGEAELVSEATTPTSPVSPKPLRDGLLGAFVGLMLGVGFALLREQFDDRIRDRSEIEHEVGLPLLAELPFDDASVRNSERLASAEAPLGGLAEAVRALRTSVQFLGVEQPIKRLLVTSPGAADGKSLVAANLAVVYAHAGFRTVLVSSDLRRPRIDAMFSESSTSPGFTGLVAKLSTSPAPAPLMPAPLDTNGNGGAPTGTPETSSVRAVHDALVNTGVHNLWMLPAGLAPPNPAELLGSRRTGEILEALDRFADVVILDSPPVLAVTDAAVLAGKVDGVLLVASLGETHRGALRRAVTSLEGSPVRMLGVVLNRAEVAPGYGYGYGYGVAEDQAGRRRFRRKRQAEVAQVGVAAAVEPDLPDYQPAPPEPVGATGQDVGEVK